MVGPGEPIGTVSLRPRAMLCVLSMGNWPAITKYLFEQDLDLVATAGFDTYRFSTSCARVMP